MKPNYLLILVAAAVFSAKRTKKTSSVKVLIEEIQYINPWRLI
jgi:hypothetical protein